MPRPVNRRGFRRIYNSLLRVLDEMSYDEYQRAVAGNTFVVTDMCVEVADEHGLPRTRVGMILDDKTRTVAFYKRRC